MDNNGIHPGPREFAPEVIAADPILRFFHYDHLPTELRAISAPFCGLAGTIIGACPRSAERTVALRKLLEAKDCAVRAMLEGKPTKPITFLDRLRVERKELVDRLDKLTEFSQSFAFRQLPDLQLQLLQKQNYIMVEYLNILDGRIADLDATKEFPLEGDIQITGGDKTETPIPFA